MSEQYNKLEQKILKIADEVAEKDFKNTDIPNAIMFMDICLKHDIKFRAAERLNKILAKAKAPENTMENIWKKVYNEIN